jgi:LysM repeat protein
VTSTMRVWTKSARLVLAWSIVLILAAVGTKCSVHRAQATTGIAGSTQIALTAAVSGASPNAVSGASAKAVSVAPATAAGAATATDAATQPTATQPQPAATYVVQPGDTLSSIAAALAVAGGWLALYAANRSVIGSDPNHIFPGTVLVLPGAEPASYTVEPGDTLSRIAAALAVPGGWAALYAANRQVIGPDPSVIQPGTALSIPYPLQSPLPAQSYTQSYALMPRLAPLGGTWTGQPALSERAGRQQPSSAEQATTPSAGMPAWLTTMLLAVALLVVAAFLTEPFAARARRRRRALISPLPVYAAVTRPARAAVTAPGRDRGETIPGKPRVVLADHDRLVVAHRAGDDTVYVLRPPSADPIAVLRVARLVLEEDPYQALADTLGVSASQPMESASTGPPTYRSDGGPEDLLRSD